ncbi:unnamed protein product [Thlaspi arvense]|uniref:Nitronate monooxygenase domain-containing protein n=1 Tax=Thlaspi arvense TaxID=13288 RepID=A0AAU9T5N2_THLAR|nr:unnamed protein product [Thlaspi arvense]
MSLKGILGFEYGIVQAPLGLDISGPELVAAITNVGGIGLVRCPDWDSPDYPREMIRKTKRLTDKPFGIGVVLAFPHEVNIKAILEEKLNLKVGNVEEARKVVAVGVDVIIVQGHVVRGHVIGKDALFSLLPRVVDMVGECDIPVIAAEKIMDGHGYIAALSLGAQGDCLGTRFVATHESYAHPIYRRRLIEYEKTKYTDIFG